MSASSGQIQTCVGSLGVLGHLNVSTQLNVSGPVNATGTVTVGGLQVDGSALIGVGGAVCIGNLNVGISGQVPSKLTCTGQIEAGGLQVDGGALFGASGLTSIGNLNVGISGQVPSKLTCTGQIEAGGLQVDGGALFGASGLTCIGDLGVGLPGGSSTLSLNGIPIGGSGASVFSGQMILDNLSSNGSCYFTSPSMPAGYTHGPNTILEFFPQAYLSALGELSGSGWYQPEAIYDPATSTFYCCTTAFISPLPVYSLRVNYTWVGLVGLGAGDPVPKTAEEAIVLKAKVADANGSYIHIPQGPPAIPQGPPA